MSIFKYVSSSFCLARLVLLYLLFFLTRTIYLLSFKRKQLPEVWVYHVKLTAWTSMECVYMKELGELKGFLFCEIFGLDA